jgi:hypothetical protein
VAHFECYRVVVCATALVDRATNMISYINLSNGWALAPEAFGQHLPFQAHFDIRGKGRYEVQLVWVDARGASSPAGDKSDAVSVDGYVHFASPQIRCPSEPGEYDLVLEWRPETLGAKWQRTTGRAPMLFRQAEVAPTKLDS